MSNFEKLVILNPFLSMSFLLIFFFLIQKVKFGNYLKNLFFTIVAYFVFNFLYVFNLKGNLENFEYFYIVCINILNIYIFINLMQIPISSIQNNILRLIGNKKVTVKSLNHKYNNNKIFKIRYNRLIKSKSIIETKNKLYIKKKILIFILSVFLILRKIVGFKND